MKFTIHKSPSTGQYWFAIKADNGQILAHSEQYAAKASAQGAINAIKAGASVATVEDLTGERTYGLR